MPSTRRGVLYGLRGHNTLQQWVHERCVYKNFRTLRSAVKEFGVLHPATKFEIGKSPPNLTQSGTFCQSIDTREEEHWLQFERSLTSWRHHGWERIYQSKSASCHCGWIRRTCQWERGALQGTCVHGQVPQFESARDVLTFLQEKRRRVFFETASLCCIHCTTNISELFPWNVCPPVVPWLL